MGTDRAPRLPLRPDGTVDMQRIWDEGTLIDDALQAAFREAIRQHKASGRPMVFWEDGRIVKLSAEEVEARLEAAEGPTER